MMRVKLTKFGGVEAELGEVKHHVFIVKSINRTRLKHRAFCGGSIITEVRVLTSAHCFYTNRKRLKVSRPALRVVGGMVTTFVKTENDDIQQWRSIEKIFTQKYFHFPAYNLAIVQVKEKWEFNQYVNKIPFASKNQDFDGVCIVTGVRPSRSWLKDKFLYSQSFKMLKTSDCEFYTLKECELYYCTAYDESKLLLQSLENEGSGLVCHGTADPKEIDEKQGVLVGVTSLVHMYLPTLHHRVGSFHKWVADSCDKSSASIGALLLCLVIKLLV